MQEAPTQMFPGPAVRVSLFSGTQCTQPQELELPENNASLSAVMDQISLF